MDAMELAKRLAAVIDQVRAVDDSKSIWGESGEQQLHLWKYPEIEVELGALGRAFEELNSMLSAEETIRRLKCDAIVPHVHPNFGRQGVPSTDVSEAMVGELLNYERYTTIELPVLYLSLPEPVEIDGVQFDRLDLEQFAKSVFGKWTYGIYDGRLTGKAKVSSPGDDWKHLTNAVDLTEGALRVLGGVVFPWQIQQAVVPSIPGSGPQPGATPFRTPVAHAETEWSGSFGSLHRPGGTLNPAKVISELWQTEAEAVLEFLRSPRNSQTEKRIYAAFRWLGEACRTHDRAGQLVAAMIGLEALLSTRNDDQRTSAGTTALLAERSAFLAGPADGRLAIHKEVTRLYGLRSDLVHGRISTVPRGDVAAAGEIAWQVARELFRRRVELATDAAVADWILTQRYQ